MIYNNYLCLLARTPPGVFVPAVTAEENAPVPMTSLRTVPERLRRRKRDGMPEWRTGAVIGGNRLRLSTLLEGP